MAWMPPGGNWNASSPDEIIRARQQYVAARNGMPNQFDQTAAAAAAAAAASPQNQLAMQLQGGQYIQNPLLIQNARTQKPQLNFLTLDQSKQHQVNLQNPLLGLQTQQQQQQQSQQQAQAQVQQQANNTNQAAMLALMGQQLANLQQSGYVQHNAVNNNVSAVANLLAASVSRNPQLGNAAAYQNLNTQNINPILLNAQIQRLNQQRLLQQQHQQQLFLQQQQQHQQQQHQQQGFQVNAFPGNKINSPSLIGQQQALQQQQQQQQNALGSNSLLAALRANSLTSSGGAGAGAGGHNGYSAITNNAGVVKSPLPGFGSTGLANTPLASAPLLPILGTDLARPSSAASQKSPLSSLPELNINLNLNVSSPQSNNTSDAQQHQQLASLPLSSSDGNMTLSSNPINNNNNSISITSMPQNTLQSNGPNQGSSGSGNNTPGTTQKERDLNTLRTLGQMLAKTGNTVESAVQTGLLGGCNAEDVKVVWEAYVEEIESLKQHDFANRPFQIPGGDTTSAAHASAHQNNFKQQLMHAVLAGNHGQMSQILGNDISKVANVNSPSTGLATAAAATANTNGISNSNSNSNVSQLAKDSSVNVNTPASVTSSMTNEQIKVKDNGESTIEEINHWNGVIENETDYVPRQIISEVNENEQQKQIAIENDPKEGEFNAMKYNFFSEQMDGDADMVPLEDLSLGDEDNRYSSSEQNNEILEIEEAFEGDVKTESSQQQQSKQTDEIH